MLGGYVGKITFWKDPHFQLLFASWSFSVGASGKAREIRLLIRLLFEEILENAHN